MRNLVLSPIFLHAGISPLGDESAFVLLSRRAVIDREPATGPKLLPAFRPFPNDRNVFLF